MPKPSLECDSSSDWERELNNDFTSSLILTFGTSAGDKKFCKLENGQQMSWAPGLTRKNFHEDVLVQHTRVRNWTRATFC